MVLEISETNQEYVHLVESLKVKIHNARTRAALAVNHELIKIYWEIGKSILEKQVDKKWGDKLIVRLSIDLRNAFPGMAGFSVRNLERMRFFSSEYPHIEFAAQLVSQLPWGHIILLMQRVKDHSIRDWYAKYALENGWSRSTLEHHIVSRLFERQGVNIEKTSNFLEKLPAPQSELALDVLKCPYDLTFTGLFDNAHEQDIESQIVNHICKFLLELGAGFSFVGRQYPLEISDKEYFVDLLFYHLKLRAYIVIEIKATPFKPEHAGQLNFYLTAVDRNLKHHQDNPTIGILLCKSHDKILAEYALSDINKPIGISNYALTKAIPANLQSGLPTIEELEHELELLMSPSKKQK